MFIYKISFMKNLLKVTYLLFFTSIGFSKTINGSFSQAKNKEITLFLFEGLNSEEYFKTISDASGKFSLQYPNDYKGAGVIQINNEVSLMVLLHNEDFSIIWEDFKDINTLQFINSYQNEDFSKGTFLNIESQNKIVGLNYLISLYKDEPNKKKWLENELLVQGQVYNVFLESIPEFNYSRQYLQLRKYLSDLQIEKKDNIYLTENFAKLKEFYSKLNLGDNYIWHSGLLNELIKSYYSFLIGNYKNNTLELENEINKANNVWLNSKKTPSLRLQVIAEFCFKELERLNLSKNSEHIALSMLNNENCKLTLDRINLFEQYRKLAVGKTAPNILNLSYNKQQIDLKKIPNKYKLVVFGSSECSNCNNEYPSLVGKYKKIKEKHDLEIIYISIDSNLELYNIFFKEAPFITYCDGKVWGSPAVKDYYVIATPTYILLNKELKIIKKFDSPAQLENHFNKMN